MNNYTLELSKRQLKLIKNSLDFYSRIQMGQFKEISTLGGPLSKDIIEKNLNIEKIDELTQSLKKEIFPELSNNSFYGIHNKDRPENSKIAYDIIQVIRHKIAWDEHPKGGVTVDFQEPFKCSKEEELININTYENVELKSLFFELKKRQDKELSNIELIDYEISEDSNDNIFIEANTFSAYIFRFEHSDTFYVSTNEDFISNTLYTNDINEIIKLLKTLE